MSPGGWKPAAACFLLGMLCFAFLPWVLAYSRLDYWIKEPYFSCPVPAPAGGVTLRSDRYGKGYFGASRNNGRKHLGVDLSVATGQPVFASKSGRIFYAGFDKGYGNYVEISHPDGFFTRYAHLSECWVSVGDWVPQGSAIGKSGKTGNADHKMIKPHLHFEIRYAKQPLNPTAWMKGLAL